MKYIFLILLIIISSCSNEQDKIQPQERDLTESVYSSVTIQPDSSYQVHAIVAGILDINLVEEGDLVKKDQPIIEIINNAPKLNTQNAKLALDLAKENYYGSAAILSGIEEEIAAAKLKLSNDSINFFRQKNLWEQKIGSKVDYDNRKLNYDLSQNNLDLLRSKYNRTKNELLTAVKQAQNSYQASLINTKDFSVKSKMNGKVYALYKEPGESVNTTQPLASIGSATNFVIELLIDEVDIVRVKRDQEVLINLDAYSNNIFKGKVSKIYPKKDERNQTFKVEGRFVQLPDVLYPGLSGEGNIIIARKDNVLTIPKEYLIDNDKVRTEDGIVDIAIGLQNLEYVEVLSGITKDTYILKPEE
ncbi:MAG: HlyD family efflux transporter periplasmic adaptor subunit [Flavobacteriaceae bacterium]|nr:HlyD family efflux transporter periplasmic adaptor subunit [Flavobacteriaceae bacterium]NNK28086.1 HlyD family efflux transporter periplasmic adaptor subunit [Flavobacteriaceae bacterium]